jgi:antitoxin (DNA-binding transcriptional repressor) of toxin-antitoxin stability system
MEQVTASEARRQWFRLLDEAAQGEIVVVHRKGRRLVLRREETDKAKRTSMRPAYRRLLRVPRVDQADRWSWEWSSEGRLASRRAPAR